MNFYIFVASLFLSILALYSHEINALLYKLESSHPHQDQQEYNNSQNLLPLVPSSNEISRQELVYLFITPPTTQLAHISISALQIRCYLQMAEIPFYAISNHFLLASPTGKSQFAQINGKIFDDPDKIIEEIEKIEAVKNKKPPKMVAKSENENKMKDALETMQNIIYADLLTSSAKKENDRSFTMDGSSQIEKWMQDDGLKEQMHLALTKINEQQSDRQGFEVEVKLKEELAKLKKSLIGFSQALGQKTIKVQPVNSKKQGFRTKLLQTSSSQIPQFGQKMLSGCNEEQLLAAFTHAVDILAPIVKPASNNKKRFLFHKKATAIEARLLATLGLLFTSTRSIEKFSTTILERQWGVDRESFDNTKKGSPISLEDLLIVPERGTVEKIIYTDKNMQILWKYFEKRSGQLGLDSSTLDALKKSPWNLEPMIIKAQKYRGLYPFETNSMKLLPQWAVDHWPEPQTIATMPLDEKTVGPDHQLLTKILEKIATQFYDYSDCRKELMHIVAAYLCKLDYKNGRPKNRNKNKKEQKNCSKWHLKEFNKWNIFKQNLLKKFIVPMIGIIDQSIEEIVGIERNVFEAIMQGMNAQEMKHQEMILQQKMDKKGKAKVDESVEDGNFMLDLF